MGCPDSHRLPDGLSIDGDTGLIAGTLTTDDTFTVIVTVDDGTYAGSETFTWNVSAAGPIAVDAVADQTSTEGDTVSLQVEADYSGSGTLTWWADNLPEGLSIDPASGLITGRIGVDAALGGPLHSTVRADDGTDSDLQMFVWTVSSPVAVTDPVAQTSTEGETVSLQVEALDADDVGLTYSAHDLPDGLSIDRGSGLISGVVGTAAEGAFAVTVTATNGIYRHSRTFTWTVVSPIALTTVADQDKTEGDSVSLQVEATSVNSDPVVFSADDLPDGLSISSGGLITGTIAPGASGNGPSVSIITAADGTYSNTLSITWVIENPVSIAPLEDRADAEGDTISLQITAEDSTSSTLFYSADGLPFGLSLDRDTGLITGTIAVGTAAYGPFETTVVATDGTYSNSQTFVWDIITPLSLDNPGDQESKEGQAVSLQVTADAGGGTLTYSADNLPYGLSIDPTTGLITGTIARGSAEYGFFISTVMVSDGTHVVEQSFYWDVTSSVRIGNLGEQFNKPVETVSLQVVASGSWRGSVLTYAASGLPDGLSIDADTGLITGTIGSGAAARGPFTTTISVSDGVATTSESFTWTMSARPTVKTLDYFPLGFTMVVHQTPADSVALSWTKASSPYFAQTLLQAKALAWLRVPDGTTDDSAVGEVVSAAFQVDPKMTWGSFFPNLERYSVDEPNTVRFFNKPTNIAIVLMHADWMTASRKPGFQLSDPVGEEVSQRWQGLLTVLTPRTTWIEFFPLNVDVLYKELVAKEIPLLTLTAEQRKALNASPSAQSVVERVGYGNRARFSDTILPRLLESTAEQIETYLNRLEAADRIVLRYCLDSMWTRWTNLGQAGYATAPPGYKAPDYSILASRVSLQLARILYSELQHRLPRSSYGVHDPDDTAFEQALKSVADVRGSGLEIADIIGRTQGTQGTYPQRLAFLADTDYATFRAREEAAIYARFGPPTADPQDKEWRRRKTALEAIPDVEHYHAARYRLISTIEAALPGKQTVANAVAPLLKVPQHRYVVTGDAWNSRWDPREPLDAQADRFVYDRYLRNGDLSRPSRDSLMIDEYLQANLGLSYLPGWQKASQAQREKFADSLGSFDRMVLVNSLIHTAATLRDRGDLPRAEAALAMGVGIEKRFNLEVEAMKEAGLEKAYKNLAATRTARLGLNNLSDEERKNFESLGPGLQRQLMDEIGGAVMKDLVENPFVVKYEPAFGLVFLDRSVLNAADFMAPVYRSGERVIGLVTWDGNRIDQFSNFEGLRQVIEGKSNVDLSLKKIHNSLGAVLLDTGMTALTVVPVGGSALRHAVVMGTSATVSSLSMAAVEVSPIPDEYKGTLRFVVGVSAGTGTALYTNAKLVRALARPEVESALGNTTLEYTRAKTLLDGATKQLAVLSKPGSPPIPDGLIKAKQVLETETKKLANLLNDLRTLGGPTLSEAEREFKKAHDALAAWETKANAPGISPSTRRALLASEKAKGARAQLAEAETKLSALMKEVDLKAAKQGLIKSVETAESAALPKGCFAGGSMMLTPDGWQPIESLREGEWVMSADEDVEDGPLTAKRIERTYHRLSAVIAVRIEGKTIRLTEEHPFYVFGRGWVAAYELKVGDPLRSHNGKQVAVESVEPTQEVAVVYNLTIEDHHTFFVGGPTWGFSVWVHNEDVACRLQRLEQDLKNASDANKPGLQHEIDELRNQVKLQAQLDKLSASAVSGSEASRAAALREIEQLTSLLNASRTAQLTALRARLEARFGDAVIKVVGKGIEDNPAKMREVLGELETLVKNVQGWRGGSRPSQLLDTDGRLREVLDLIFVKNTAPGGILQNIAPRDLLHDMAEVSDLPNFVRLLRQLKKPDEAIKGYVAALQEVAKDSRTLGRYHPSTNPDGVRDVSVGLFGGPKNIMLDDLDLISGSTIWEVKVGAQGGWNSPHLAEWIDLAVKYGNENGIRRIGFRLSEEAVRNKFNTTNFQRVLAEKQLLYPKIEFVVKPTIIKTPPIP